LGAWVVPSHAIRIRSDKYLFGIEMSGYLRLGKACTSPKRMWININILWLGTQATYKEAIVPVSDTSEGYGNYRPGIEQKPLVPVPEQCIERESTAC
jgi:hypothetical protein